MKKGFTLIEILAVVTIMGLIFILVIPKIGTSLKHKKKDVDTTTNNLIITAAKNYVNDNHDMFDKVDNNTYCLPLTTLTKKDYLDSPVKNVTDDLDITNSKSVKITYNKGFKYEVVDKKECSVAYIPPCESDYCDSNGNRYIEVEYLESAGTQYIDTEVRGINGLKIDVNYYIRDFNANRNYVFGSASESGNRIQWSHTNSSFAGYGNEYNNALATTNNSNMNHIILDKGAFYLNDTKIYDKSNVNYNFSADMYSIYLFACNLNGRADNFSSIRIYSAKIYEGNTLLRDYVPMLDKNNLPCLFDKVEKKCYYNQGTGEFLYG